ncbi:DUF6443 domain-containing protein [Parapedobacter koreensis]|uniref:RHS repeat-associated core domain-containing protein n=1 Tax=Parapedobacter koreensis TaxID=332977 RepID=A0A1H7IQH9_9SPHI|nr:DUF6443 domain-containing protein [Parapedobacter koreensis]SEK63850.1 RHS repeat-associated core domain-containing protein [Parapedobacter koreensis]
MKHQKINLLLPLMVALFPFALVLGQSTNKNYVRMSIPMVPTTTPTALDAIMADYTKVRVNIDYYDGLGRALQSVASKAAPGAVDLVTPIAYDALGRQDKGYMPYPAGTGNAFRTNAVSAQQTYYSGTAPAGQPTTGKAHTATVYEASPLNRVKEQGFPGEVWQPAGSRTATAGRTVATSYLSNNTVSFTTRATTRMATRYSVTLSTAGVPTLTSNSYYGSSQLTVKVTRNENWAGGSGTFASRLHTTEEYTDKHGRMVLSRTFNLNGSTEEILSTYYVYDNLGNLCFVLPPEINPDKTSGVPTATELNNLAYQYRYDGRGRIIEKKSPGIGWENFVYLPSGKVLLHQDARQVSETIPGFTPGQYHTFYKYDRQGRLALSGIERNRVYNRQQIQDIVDAQTLFWEDRSTATGNVHGYTNVSIPQGAASGDMDVTLVNYYDDYAGIPGLPHNQSASYSKLTRGLLVASKAKVLGTASTYLWTVNYYDDEGRLVRQWKQHYLGGSSTANKFDDTTNEYDFNGQLTKSTRKLHTTNATTPEVTVVTEYTYDHTGRLLDTWKTVNPAPSNPAGTRTLIARNGYNEVGQLRTKRLHSTNGTSFGQTVTYGYNHRGWLRTTSTAPSMFNQELQYTEGTNKQYNGNIAYQLFTRHNLATPTPALVTNTYTYTYDAVGRLTQGAMAGNKGRETLTYDRNGNIKTLVRTGTNSTAVDNLTYNLTGNRLTSIVDAVTATDANYQLPGTTSYTYDVNGNVKTRSNTGSTGNNITAITYNYLNLPQNLTAVAGNVTYTYDATGRKLRSVNGINTQTRDYIDGIEYTGNGATMELIYTEEGRITRSGSTYTYHYFLRDHLGNNRVGFAGTTPGTANFTADYYPYGLQYREVIRAGAPIINYLYAGKEFQNGLKLYDFGSRFYDATIGRWGVPDPAEQFVNPYLALGNNPIIYADPDGEWIHIVVGALVGGVANLTTKWLQGDIGSVGDGFAAFGIGAAAGAVGAATGGAALAASGMGAASIGGGALIGAYSSAAAGPVLGLGNAAYFGDPYSANDWAMGVLVGGVTGGIGGGISNVIGGKGLNIWTGKPNNMEVGVPRITQFGNRVVEGVDDVANGGVQYSDDLVKAAQKAYPELAGKTQLHHITPKYLGGAANGPLVPLDAAYHQQITNAFRQAWPYGQGVIKDPVLIKQIMDQVYKRFPLPPGYGY